MHGGYLKKIFLCDLVEIVCIHNSSILIEPLHEKKRVLLMQKQRSRSALSDQRIFSLHG